MYKARLHLDKFCRDHVGLEPCEHYHEFEYFYVLEDHNMKHESSYEACTCKLNSDCMEDTNIDRIPRDCPHMKSMIVFQMQVDAAHRAFELKCEQEAMWEKLETV